MKQVVFAVLLLAMASFTGCLTGDDSSVDENTDTIDDSTSDTTEENSDTTEENSDTTDDTKDDELLDPVGEVGGHMSPKTSTIKVDYGIQGHWHCEDGEYIEDSDGNETWVEGECEYTPCPGEGWQEFVLANGDEDTYYCDLDGHYNRGSQVIITKNGNEVTIECIKSWNECKYYDDNVYVIFTSIEGLKELIYCDTLRYQEENNIFNTCKATLGFEPVSFEVSHEMNRFGYLNTDEAYQYYEYVSFRVF
tara:strand:- start:113 stop:862 length:750 start_codon:yes stop_codon:yes gene_type:complete